ncbi:hypothetical protein JTE90_018694 [Oedothorax gibbosus]|uniref:Uncharacterized protein n=1 Tax=Oedothorax gibbosus TaxID=931172 RepID=A0AAV6V1P7_9ARAC|nr:hypothetical protein JTE90_018694 [Oedothorax gibbosus]
MAPLPIRSIKDIKEQAAPLNFEWNGPASHLEEPFCPDFIIQVVDISCRGHNARSGLDSSREKNIMGVGHFI